MDIPFGERYIGFWGNSYGDQKRISSYNEIKEFVESHLGIDNIGISISTYKDGVPFLLFLPFDFDSGTLIDAWEDAKKLYLHLRTCNYGAYLIFSGRKGFHVLVPTIPRLYTKRQLRTIQMMFKTMLDLKTLDEQIFGDIRRLMRLPNTYNINGDLCRVISSNEGEELDLDKLYHDDFIPLEVYKNGIKREHKPEYHDYDCIESLVRSDPEPRHLIRFTYTVLRLAEGYSYDEILDEMESFGWADFDPEYSRKQIEHIDGRNYVPPSCDTLRDMGYCVVQDCPHAKTITDMLKEVKII
jgi:hypothetical protein